MNRFLLVIYLNISILQLSSGQAGAIINQTRDIEFANFLFNNQQFEYASQEYLKLIYLYPENTYLKKRTLEAFRLSNDLQSGLFFSKVFFNPTNRDFIQLYPEIVKLKLLSKKPILSEGMIIDSTLFDLQYNESKVLDFMLSGEWVKVSDYSENITKSNLYQFVQNTPEGQFKNPCVASALSLIVPGSGKVYANRWKDGLSSLLFIGITGFQSYRGFNKSGINSAYGWIMGGLSFGFYIGNIYGSFKAAKEHNKLLHEEYWDKVVHYYIDHY